MDLILTVTCHALVQVLSNATPEKIRFLCLTMAMLNADTSVSRMLTCFCMQNELLYFVKLKFVQWLLTTKFWLKAFYFLSLLWTILKMILSNYFSWFILAYFLLSFAIQNIKVLHLLPTFYNLASIIYWCVLYKAFLVNIIFQWIAVMEHCFRFQSGATSLTDRVLLRMCCQFSWWSFDGTKFR